jgi:hypothetical protein
VASAQTVAPADPELSSDKDRYRTGQTVTISLQNQADYPLMFENPWRIENRDGEAVASISWPEELTTIPQGEIRVARWDQRSGECSPECDSSDPARELVGPGRYKIVIDTQDGTVRRSIRIGEYFTLGFESRPQAKFVVYVTTASEVEQMTAEAEAEDKTLIVSGIVQHRKRYNRAWKFSMGPGTIVLGEFFIEVCDGSPYYVQRHKKEWLGERWCPWSSYVEKIGR